MSRALILEPVVSQVTTAKIANPVAVQRVTQALEVMAHQFSGTPTATPEQPPG
jgi:hypothetical protein